MDQTSAPFQFARPLSLTAAQERIALLRMECRSIQGQLSHAVRYDVEGQPLSPEAYTAWRGRAEFALQVKLAEITYLETWRDQKLQAADRALVEQTFMVDTGDTLSLLGGLYQLVAYWLRASEVHADPAERTFLNVVRDHLRDHLPA